MKSNNDTSGSRFEWIGIRLFPRLTPMKSAAVLVLATLASVAYLGPVPSSKIERSGSNTDSSTGIAQVAAIVPPRNGSDGAERRTGTVPAEVVETPSHTAPTPPLFYPELARIAALEELPGSDALIGLRPFLSDNDPAIRFAALQQMADLNHPERSIYLVVMLQDPVPMLRIAALEALAQGRDAGATRSIEGLLFDFDPEVRIAAIDALGALEDRTAAHTLGGLLGDPDARVRGHAVNALGETGGAIAIGYLRQARHDTESKIRANAEAILAELEAAD